MIDEKTTHGSGERLKRIREAKGYSVTELAALLEISEAYYYDLEAFDEMENNLSLFSSFLLCRKLDTSPSEIFGFANRDGKVIKGVEFSNLIKAKNDEEQSLGQRLEDKTGWDVTDALAHPNAIAKSYDFDAIVDICNAINVEWEAVVAGLWVDFQEVK